MSQWICADAHPNEPRFYYFNKTFTAKTGDRFIAKMSGDTRYQLRLNGKLLSEGPCMSPTQFRYYEEVDLTDALVEGENKLTACVMHGPVGYLISMWGKEHPAFWFDGDLIRGDEVIKIGTDESWSCHYNANTKLAHQPYQHTSIPPYEVIKDKPYLVPLPVKTMYEPNLSGEGCNYFGIMEPYPLRRRIIPQMMTYPARPFKVVREGEGFIELDAGTYTTAKIDVTFSAARDSDVTVIYAESYCLQDPESGHHYKGIRDAYDDPNCRIQGSADVLRAIGKPQTFEPFWYRAFRFIRIEFDPTAEFELKSITYSPYFYPMEEEGTFSCSDERFNRMWDISRNTVLCCSHESYVDCPYYEQQQYAMDSGLEMLFTFRMCSDLRLPYKSLVDLASSQTPSGLLCANYPSTATQIIPNFSLYWILMLRDYLLYTGDRDGTRRLLGTMDKALQAFENLREERGLVGRSPYWNYVDWAGWPGGETDYGGSEPQTVSSLMYATALQAAADIYSQVGSPERVAEYRRRAGEMGELVKKYCYDEERGLFRDTPTSGLSQHTSVWAVLSGTVTGDEAGALIDRTFSTEGLAQCSFSMNYYMFRALEKAGRYAYADKLYAGWLHMMDLHTTSWWENPGHPRSECHGWSSAPIYEFTAMVLGVQPTSAGYDTVRIRPVVDGLGFEWAKGTIPTPKGLISVSWKKEDGKLTLDVSIPEDTDMATTVDLPDGQSFSMTRSQERFICNA